MEKDYKWKRLEMEKRLEIGSGSKPKKGFIHFDIRKNVNADFVGDAEKLPFKDEEFVEVFSRFFLEHLPRKKAKQSIKEMFRVLKSKGVLTIIVPDLRFFCKLFLKEQGQKKEWALNKIFGFENYFEDHHYFGYDLEYLTRLLEENGFVNIKRLETDEQYLHVVCNKP